MYGYVGKMGGSKGTLPGLDRTPLRPNTRANEPHILTVPTYYRLRYPPMRPLVPILHQLHRHFSSKSRKRSASPLLLGPLRHSPYAKRVGASGCLTTRRG